MKNQEMFNEYLRKDEVILAMIECVGTRDVYIYLTNQRIIKPKTRFVKTGFLSGKNVLEDDFSVELGDIIRIKRSQTTGPSVMVGMVQNYATIEITTELTSHTFRMPMSSRADEKADRFVKMATDELIKIKPKEEQKDVPRLLWEYAKLRDDGIITEDEFQARKRKLFGDR